MLFQTLQFLFGSILLFDIPKDLSNIFFKRVIISKHNLGRILSYNSNLPFNYFVVYEIIDISLDLIESYTAEITNNIYYFS
jgi:isoprenylcysteine carboxyl methyltransferase (ICMT) family protein YpbQ